MRSIKFKDDNYLDSTSIVHNRENLSEILNSLDENVNDFSEEIECLTKSKVDISGKVLIAGNTATFTIGNRAVYLICTTNNSQAIRRCWLLLTNSGTGNVINLGGIGSSISISSSNTTLTITNNGAYNCGVYITEIANDAGGILT